MINIPNILALIAAYLIGSIATAVWIGKIFYGIDVRDYGSGNAGATNTFRVLGKKAGIPVMLIDIFKGWSAANLVYFMPNYNVGTIPYVNFQLLLGIIAVFGHLYPVFTKFKGGKGVATSFGMLVAIHPEASLCCILIFIASLLLTKYVSLSSILAGLSLPITIAFLFKVQAHYMVIFAIIVCFIIMVTHQKNIERLIAGNESKANLFKRKINNR